MTKDEILANAKIVVRELMSEPDALPLKSACAVAGNGWQENLMRPITTGAKDHGSDGLLQWRLDRLTMLQRMPDWATLPAQCRFFKAECKARYPSLWKQLVNPGNRTLENLTANICDLYENPSRAGRKLDDRISYSRQVMAVFDAQAPVTPPPIVIPPGIPQPVGQSLVWLLNNIFTGGISTFGGVLSLVYAWLVYSHTQLSSIPINSDWKPWMLLGLILVFAVGKSPTQPEPQATESPPTATQPKAPNMNPNVILNVMSLIESLVPILEKVLADIPQIQKDIESIKTGLTAAQQPNETVDARFADLLAKLNALSPTIHP